MILLKANNTFGAWESIKGPVLSHNTASLRTKRCLMVHGKCWMSSRIIPHENKNRIYLNNCLQYYSIFPLFYCVFHRKQEVEQVGRRDVGLFVEFPNLIICGMTKSALRVIEVLKIRKVY